MSDVLNERNLVWNDIVEFGIELGNGESHGDDSTLLATRRIENVCSKTFQLLRRLYLTKSFRYS